MADADCTGCESLIALTQLLSGRPVMPQPDRADGQSIITKFRVLPLHAERLHSELDTSLVGPDATDAPQGRDSYLASTVSVSIYRLGGMILKRNDLY